MNLWSMAYQLNIEQQPFAFSEVGKLCNWIEPSEIKLSTKALSISH